MEDQREEWWKEGGGAPRGGGHRRKEVAATPVHGRWKGSSPKFKAPRLEVIGINYYRIGAIKPHSVFAAGCQ